jgi:signal transduction histidine kinase/streptogramin lyase
VHDPADPHSLTHNSIFGLLVDRSGILWAASMGGVIKLDPNRKPFRLYRHNPLRAGSLSHNHIAAIYEDKQGTVWVGTSGGGLDKLNKQTGAFTHHRHEPGNSKSLRSDSVTAILEDHQGVLWVGNGKTLSRFDRQAKTFTHFPLAFPFQYNPGSSPIFTIYEDRQGLLWIGTNNGIIQFNRQTGRTINYPFDPDHPERIGDYWALSLLEDRKGNLWIGPGSQALTRFDPQTSTYTQYKHDSRKPGSIPSATIPTIYEDSRGNLWFGTGDGGLCRFDHATQTFTTYNERQGLAGNSVFSILEDNASNLWLGTNRGLSKFSLAKQTFTNYGADEGLQGNMFTTLYTEGAAFKGKDGTLYFGGSNGFNAFDPSKIRPNTYVPSIVITQVKVFDKLLPGRQQAQQISLEYNQNFISIEFASLNYTNSPKNQYAYQLVGLEKDWVYSGSRRLASYTDLGPGDYTFRVKGSNNDGHWNQQGTSIRFIIHPPWWRTWWAYLLYGLLSAAGVWAFIAYRSRALHRENRLLEEKVALRTDQLERKSTELEHSLENLKSTQVQLVQKEKMASLGELTAGIAHEIQNPLNFVNNFSEVSTELVEELDGELDKGETQEAKLISADLKQNLQKITLHGTRASSIVRGMLEHARTTTGKRQPTDLNALCEEYLRLAYHGFRAKDKGFNAELKTNFNSNLDPVEVVPQEIGRVLLNLFNNAFYALNQRRNDMGSDETYKPTVWVSTRHKEGQIVIGVIDNGTGMPESVKHKIFQPFFTTKPTGEGTGLGLSLSYDIVTKGHGGSLTVESQEGEGTAFTIQLPTANGSSLA